VFLAIEQDDDQAAQDEKAIFDNDCALFQQGLMYFEHDEPERALECFLRADHKYSLPGKEDLWSNLGATCHELDRYDEAVAWYEKALAERASKPIPESDGSVDDEEWLSRLRDQEDLLKRSLELAANREPPIGVPGELGLE
jgi:tetratricopeptide (TPR) repeat protein